jgi:hypothetical protein
VAEAKAWVLAVAEDQVASRARGRGGGVDDGGASRRYCAQSRSARVAVSVGWRRRRFSCVVPLAPTYPFIAQRDGGPPARNELGAPDQGAEVRRPIGPVRVRWSTGRSN